MHVLVCTTLGSQPVAHSTTFCLGTNRPSFCNSGHPFDTTVVFTCASLLFPCLAKTKLAFKQAATRLHQQDDEHEKTRQGSYGTERHSTYSMLTYLRNLSKYKYPPHLSPDGTDSLEINGPLPPGIKLVSAEDFQTWIMDVQVMDDNPIYNGQTYRLQFKFTDSYPIGIKDTATCAPLIY